MASTLRLPTIVFLVADRPMHSSSSIRMVQLDQYRKTRYLAIHFWLVGIRKTTDCFWHVTLALVQFAMEMRDYIFANMKAEIVIRRARPNDNKSVHALVQAIANETFAYLFASSQVPIGEPNWISAWVAISGEEIVALL